LTARSTETSFAEVVGMIQAARGRAIAAVNTALVELYWRIGEYISRRVAEDGWGKGTVEALAEAIRRRIPNVNGYSARNLWRMSQFFETYRNQPKLSAQLTELSWSHNLAIMSRCKRHEEREFYLRLASRERWSFRELERRLAGALFERVILSLPKQSTRLAELHPEAAEVFVEYALSRSMSPALVAEYQTCLPERKLLQAKLHEFYELAQERASLPAIEDKEPAKRRKGRKR
jgi:predicted nuclease of restriction endonuclease-like (RecB) superfamily